MKNKIKELLKVKAQLKDLEKREKELKEELLNNYDFDLFEESGITIKKQSRPTYRLNISVKELQKKYPDAVELKPRSPAKLREIDRSIVDRTLSQTLVIKGL